jgi:hypothetical protein
MSWSDLSGSIGPVQLRPGWIGQRPKNPGSMKRKEEEGDEGWKEEKILIAALACQDAAFSGGVVARWCLRNLERRDDDVIGRCCGAEMVRREGRPAGGLCRRTAMYQKDGCRCQSYWRHMRIEACDNSCEGDCVCIQKLVRSHGRFMR